MERQSAPLGTLGHITTAFHRTSRILDRMDVLKWCDLMKWKKTIQQEQDRSRYSSNQPRCDWAIFAP